MIYKAILRFALCTFQMLFIYLKKEGYMHIYAGQLDKTARVQCAKVRKSL